MIKKECTIIGQDFYQKKQLSLLKQTIPMVWVIEIYFMPTQPSIGFETRLYRLDFK